MEVEFIYLEGFTTPVPVDDKQIREGWEEFTYPFKALIAVSILCCFYVAYKVSTW